MRWTLSVLFVVSFVVDARGDSPRFVAIDTSASGACAATSMGQVECRFQRCTVDKVGLHCGQEWTTETLAGVDGVLDLRVDSTRLCVRRAAGWSCWYEPDSAGKARSAEVALTEPIEQLEVNGIIWALRGARLLGGSGGDDLSDDVPPMKGLRSISIGANHKCGVSRAGGVLCSGVMRGDEGAENAAPRTVRGLSGAVEVVSGDEHSCARLRDGGVRCWGSGYEGVLGDGVRYPSDRGPKGAVSVKGLRDALALAAGGFATCALRRGGAVACWGSVGLAPDGASYAPVEVPGLPPAQRLVGKHGSFCAITRAGEVWCWGKSFSPRPTRVFVSQ